MNTITITLPLPPKQLSPNYTVGSRGQRMAKSRVTKQYRKTAAWYALGFKEPRFKAARVELDFYFATNRRRDKDNLLASMKAAFDGFADAGIVDNDADFEYASPRQHKDPDNPRVVVTVIPLDESDT